MSNLMFPNMPASELSDMPYMFTAFELDVIRPSCKGQSNSSSTRRIMNQMNNRFPSSVVRRTNLDTQSPFGVVLIFISWLQYPATKVGALGGSHETSRLENAALKVRRVLYHGSGGRKWESLCTGLASPCHDISNLGIVNSEVFIFKYFQFEWGQVKPASKEELDADTSAFKCVLCRRNWFKIRASTDQPINSQTRPGTLR